MKLIWDKMNFCCLLLNDNGGLKSEPNLCIIYRNVEKVCKTLFFSLSHAPLDLHGVKP